MQARPTCTTFVAAVLAVCAVNAANPRNGLPSLSCRKRVYRHGSAVLRLFARSFAQGEAVYVELLADSASGAPVMRYNGREVVLNRRAWGYRGFFAIPADSVAGEKTIVVDLPGSDPTVPWRSTLTVAPTRFAISRTPLEVGRYSDIDHARDPETQRYITICAAKKAAAFSRRGRDLLSGPFVYPCDSPRVTSSFWSSRVYERYRVTAGTRMTLPPSRKIHRGIDLRGVRGDPVYAMADGEVALADSLYYEGNFVILDHGAGVISYYMHLDSLLVSAGDRVRAGRQIATVGATGVATGAHLHVSVLVDGIHVDPFSLLPLPVRE